MTTAATISENTIGVDFLDVFTPGTISAHPPFKTGTTVQGNDGSRYTYAKANATIADELATVNITLSSGEYVAAATGGDSTNDTGQALASGDYAWFKLA